MYRDGAVRKTFNTRLQLELLRKLKSKESEEYIPANRILERALRMYFEREDKRSEVDRLSDTFHNFILGTELVVEMGNGDVKEIAYIGGPKKNIIQAKYKRTREVIDLVLGKDIKRIVERGWY